jgi:serine/threonine-protein kinase MRCK
MFKIPSKFAAVFLHLCDFQPKTSFKLKTKTKLLKSIKHREVLERPSSQMSYLEHFLKESATSPIANNIYNNVPVSRPKMGISVMSSQSDHSEHAVTSPTSATARPLVSPSSAPPQPIYHNHPVISSPRSNYSLDDRDGVARNLSFSSSKSNLSDDYNRGRAHQFVVRSFTTPTKCMHCTSLMVS